MHLGLEVAAGGASSTAGLLACWGRGGICPGRAGGLQTALSSTGFTIRGGCGELKGAVVTPRAVHVGMGRAWSAGASAGGGGTIGPTSGASI